MMINCMITDKLLVTIFRVKKAISLNMVGRNKATALPRSKLRRKFSNQITNFLETVSTRGEIINMKFRFKKKNM